MHRNEDETPGDVILNRMKERRETIIANSLAAQKQIAQAVRITGALGTFAHLINHCFVKTGVLYNERTLYQSAADKNLWLRFTKNGRWMVSSTEHKDENLLAGFCCCRDYGHLDPSYAQIWYVFGNEGVFRIQARVKAIAMNLNEIDSTFLDLKRDSLSAVKIQGATGPHAHKINGVYRRQKVGKQDKETRARDFFSCKRSLARPSTLSYDSSGHWVVIQDSNMLAHCGFTGFDNPCDPMLWYVVNSATIFSVQNNMAVIPFGETSAIDTEDRTGKMSQRQTPNLNHE